MLSPDDVKNYFGFKYPMNIDPPAINQIIDTHKEQIKNWVGTNDRALKELVTYLNKDLAHADERFESLFFFNHFFNARERYLGDNPNHVMMTLQSSQFVEGLRRVMNGYSADHQRNKATLKNIYGQKGFRAIWQLYNDSPDFSALNVLAVIAQHNGVLDHVGPRELVALSAILAGNPPGPPGQGMAGGMEWGKGELPNADLNKLVHFHKHCLRVELTAMPPARTYRVHGGNPDEFEPWKWLARLRYQITRAYVEAHGDTAVAGFTNSVNRIFQGGTRLSTGDQARLFFGAFLVTQPNLIARLENDYMPTYLNHVRAVSARLLNPFMIVNSGKIQIVGVSNDDQFVAGKWDDALRQFTISTSYINPGKIDDNRPYRLWDI